MERTGIGASTRGGTIAVLLAILLVAAAFPPGADAGFPGKNGKIAFDSDSGSGNREIVVMNGDGTGVTQITSNPARDELPSWSPDGTRIVFHTNRDGNFEIYTMNADGTGLARITNNTADDAYPKWSPDGTKIAFASNRDGNYEIYTMNADGSSPARLTTNPPFDGYPSWSPDGAKIAFHSYRDNGSGIFKYQIVVMNANGTGQTNLTPDPAGQEHAPTWSPNSAKIAFESNRGISGGYYRVFSMNANGTGQTQLTNPSTSFTDDQQPNWSPDGTRIAFMTDRDGPFQIYSMNADGTGPTRLTTAGTDDRDPDWQPVLTGYVRPKGATPLRVSLVPAFNPCVPAAANRAHGAPLSNPSCAPPVAASTFLTVGTPDANGAPANGSGSLLFNVKADATDVLINMSTSDVRCQSPPTTTCGSANAAAGPDYAGDLRATASLRLTDRLNTPYPGGPGPGTVADTSFPIAVPCAVTADATIGSSCAVSTSANAVMPGSIQSGKRSIWELGQVFVYDGGADGLGSTTGDNTLFETQGVFIP
jgi:Tol biopolymer transport system component